MISPPLHGCNTPLRIVHTATALVTQAPYDRKKPIKPGAFDPHRDPPKGKHPFGNPPDQHRLGASPKAGTRMPIVPPDTTNHRVANRSYRQRGLTGHTGENSARF